MMIAPSIIAANMPVRKRARRRVGADHEGEDDDGDGNEHADHAVAACWLVLAAWPRAVSISRMPTAAKSSMAIVRSACTVVSCRNDSTPAISNRPQ